MKLVALFENANEKLFGLTMLLLCICMGIFMACIKNYYAVHLIAQT